MSEADDSTASGRGRISVKNIFYKYNRSKAFAHLRKAKSFCSFGMECCVQQCS